MQNEATFDFLLPTNLCVKYILPLEISLSLTLVTMKGEIMKRKKFCVSVVVLSVSLCLLSWTIGAENKEDAIDALLDSARDNDAFIALLKAKTIRCFLGKGCTADWNTGDPNLTIGKWREKPEDCIMIFDSIDLKRGTARFVGGLGSTDVKVIPTPEGVTFFETSGSGNVMITTVFPSYKKGTKKHIFVHSRHLNYFGGPLPSQYHGICETLQ